MECVRCVVIMEKFQILTKLTACNVQVIGLQKMVNVNIVQLVKYQVLTASPVPDVLQERLQ